MRITILTDDPASWFIPFGVKLKEKLSERGHAVSFVHHKSEIQPGEVCFLLSCTKLVSSEDLKKNENNIVVHASDLPKGKGFSPLQWQILEGENAIPLTLFEAVDAVDAGPYYLKESLHLDGTELYDTLRAKLGEKIIDMCCSYIDNRDSVIAVEQSGDETFYRRRTSKDDEVNVESSIKDLFNHFRIADNEKFPLYFFYRGKKYFLKIYQADNEG